MSTIPVDLSANVAATDATAVGRSAEPVSAESASFGEHLQRVNSPALKPAVKTEKSEDDNPAGQDSLGINFHELRSDQCYACLDPSVVPAESAILVLGELPAVLPEATDTGASGEEIPTDDESLALPPTDCILVINPVVSLVPQTELTTVETTEARSKAEGEAADLDSVVVKLPTAGQQPADGVFRRVGGSPIFDNFVCTLPASSDATNPSFVPESGTAEPTITERAVSEVIVVDPTLGIETSSEVASQVRTKKVPKRASELGEAAQPAVSRAGQVEPIQEANRVDADPRQSANHENSPVSESSAPNTVPPILDRSGALHGTAPALLVAATSSAANQGKSDRLSGSQVEPVQSERNRSTQSVASLDQTTPPSVPTSERSSVAPSAPMPALTKTEAGISKFGGGVGEVDRVQFVKRVARAVHSAAERGGEIRLRLSPPELGSLTLEVIVREGVLNARLETETTTAKSILMDNLPALRERLAEQNVKIDRFDVNVRDGSSGLPDQTSRQSDAETQRESAARGKNRRGDVSTGISKPSAGTPRVIGHGQINVIV